MGVSSGETVTKHPPPHPLFFLPKSVKTAYFKGLLIILVSSPPEIVRFATEMRRSVGGGGKCPPLDFDIACFWIVLYDF